MPRFELKLPRMVPSPVLLILTLLVSPIPGEGTPPAQAASTFLPVLGWEDDVDLVVSPGGEFMIVCEEKEDGSGPPQFQIIDLDPVTGQLIAPRYMEIALGFENGVDPIITSQGGVFLDFSVLVPTENEDGSLAGLIVLRVDPTGAVLERHAYDLGNLGYKPDVDGIATVYPDRRIGWYPLASEDNTVRGVIAVDIDPFDNLPAGDAFGTATLLSTDGRVVAQRNILVDWLPGLPEGVDPLAFNSGFSARLVLPVTSAVGSDLLMIDFDPGCVGCEPPDFLGHLSVKDITAAGAHPLAFPGYERDVDLALFGPGSCGLDADDVHILIPVEGAGDVGDLYMVSGSGGYEWAYSVVNAGVPITGYEQGVDLLALCDLPVANHPHRLAVPIENDAGTDANLLLVNAATGQLVLHVEIPTINPGLVIPGWEIGVEPLPWLPTVLLAPVEGPAGAGLLSFDVTTGVRLSGSVAATFLGFVRSVDPIVAPLPDPDRTLFVPVARDDGTQADVLMFVAPPDLGAPVSLETINPPLAFKPFEWDVDVGLVKKSDPGGAFFSLPEETITGSSARLRFESVPTVASGRVLVVATQAPNPATPGSLHLFRTSDGSQIIALNDVLGLETGLDMASGRGPMIAANPPAVALTAGYDADTDPTLAWLVEAVGVDDAGPSPSLRLSHANPITLPGRIRFSLPAATHVRVTIHDVAGRRVRHLFDGVLDAGERAVVWDGLDDRSVHVRAGMYVVQVAADGGRASSKIVVVSP